MFLINNRYEVKQSIAHDYLELYECWDRDLNKSVKAIKF